MSYKICVLYSFLCVVRGKIAKHKMTELHSQIGTFSDLFDNLLHTASEEAESTYKKLLFSA